MSRVYEFETFDVFTSERFTGNQLAVVFDAEGLSTEDMQTITREFNLSETTFVLPPQDAGNTARVRIFTLGYEMPFAGHPTVGTAIAIARRRRLEGGLRLELNAGLFPVTVNLDGVAAFAEFENPNLPEESGDAPDPAGIEAALGLGEGAIDRAAHRPRMISAGVEYLYAKASLDAVRNANLDVAAFRALGLDNTIGLYLYADGGDLPGSAFHARMFAPDAGIPEDPATGSAAAAFPGQIALSETLPDGEHVWIVEQGFELGRPSRIRVSVEIENAAPRRVRIGGGVVPVQRGEIEV
ncbi:MAG: PhzF family phenazine biosynthesis protein [Pseudomonadota bacterium]